MNTVEILRAARALIENPANWTKEHLARDLDDSSVLPSSGDAVCWCAAGAVMRAASDDAGPAYTLARDELIHALPEGHTSLVNFNDDSGHADVLALFDRAIAIA